MSLLQQSLIQLRRWRQLVAELILPPECVCCNGPLVDGRSEPEPSLYPSLCPTCQQEFVPRKAGCRSCGLPLESELGCFGCRDKEFAFDEVFTLGSYDGRLAESVLRMKYEAGQPLAFAVGRELGKRVMLQLAGNQLSGCNDLNSEIDIVTCVPKHWTKRVFTGVNGPEIIMEGLSVVANLSTAADLLRCSRRIRKQSLLSPNQRRKNVRRAWSISDDYALHGARVLVVDDIMTTGATAHELALALKRAGAEYVGVAIVGRAKRSGSH